MPIYLNASLLLAALKIACLFAEITEETQTCKCQTAAFFHAFITSTYPPYADNIAQGHSFTDTKETFKFYIFFLLTV